MTLHRYAAALLLGLAATGPALAADGPIDIDDAWVRATVPGQPNGAGYMEIENEGKQNDRLLEVRSDAAERVEIHTVDSTGGVARMRQVDGVDVSAGGEVKFAPGGFHVMFLKLKAPFKEGDRVSATLRFEHAGEVPVQFEVKPAAYGGGKGGGHGGHDMGGMDHGAHGAGMKH